MKIYLSAILFLVISCSHSQVEIEPEKTSKKELQWPKELAGLEIDSSIALDPKYRFQMVYTPVINGEIGKSISFNTDQYYYPASVVKVPTALVALEKMERLGISLDDYIIFDILNRCGSTRFTDICKANKVSFRQMITELIVVSDNHFYNTLYHFVTPDELNEKLKSKGYDQTSVFKAFTGCDKIEQLHTYAWKVYDSKGNEVVKGNDVTLDSTELYKCYSFTEDRLFGSKHENDEGDIVDGPYDLNFMPEIRMEDLNQMLLRLLYPDKFEEQQRWNISEEHRMFVLDLMGKYPSEIKGSYRSLNRFEDNVYKYAVPQVDLDVRVLNKLGLSYGFASEVVYVPVDENNGFVLSYSIYVNENDTVNDGEYEYEDVARKFAEQLATTLYYFTEYNTN